MCSRVSVRARTCPHDSATVCVDTHVRNSFTNNFKPIFNVKNYSFFSEIANTSEKRSRHYLQSRYI